MVGWNAGSIVSKLVLEKSKWSASIKAVKEDQKSLSGLILNNSASIKKMGRSMAIAGGVIVGAFGLAVKSAVTFNREMANVATLIPNSTERVLELKGAVQDLATTTGKSTSDIAGGLYQVISAFGDTADTAKILEVNVLAAAAGMATTKDSINLTSAVMKGYGNVSLEATKKVADLAFQTVKLGQTTFPELAQSMGRAIPVAAKLGVSQEELFTGFATLTGVTGDATMVTTQLFAAMNSLMKPSTDMAKAIKELGYTSAETMVQELGLVGSMRELVETTDGSVESVGKLIPNIRALPAVFALTGGQAEIFDQKLEKIKESAGAMPEAFREMSEGINSAGFNMARLKEMTVVLTQRIGDSLAPAIGELVVSVGEIVSKVSDWIKEHPKLTQIIAKATLGLGAMSMAMGPILIMLPGLIQGFTLLRLANIKLAGSFGLLVPAIGLAYAAYKALMAIRDKYHKEVTGKHIPAADAEQQMWNKLEERMGRFTDALRKLSGKMKEQGVQWEKSGEIIKKIDESWQEHGQTVETYKEILAGKWGEEAKKALSAIGGAELEAAMQAGELAKATGEMNDIIKKATEATKGLNDEGFKPLADTIPEVMVKTETYTAALKETTSEINALSTSISTTAIPAFRDMSGVLDSAVGEMEDRFLDIPEAVEKVEKSVDVLGESFKRLGGLFKIMASDAAGAFASLLSSVGTAFKAIGETTDKSFEGILTAIMPVVGDIGAAFGEMISGIADNFGALGAEVGSAVGAIVGVIAEFSPALAAVATAVGGLLGGIIGALFGKGMTEAEKEAERAAEHLVQSIEDVKNVLSVFGEISDATAEKIAEARKEMEGFAAISLNFAAIIKDVGVTQENINDLWDRADDIIHQIADGSIEAEDGIVAINDSFELLLAGAQKFGTEGSAAMVEFINKVKASGLEIAAVTDYINDQLGVVQGNSMNAAEGLAAMAAGVGNSEAAMARLETATLAVYNAMIANGATANQAMESLGDTLAAITAKHEEMGTTASAAIQELLKVSDIISTHKVLMDAIEGNLAVLIALGNTGSLTQDILDDSADSAKRYYNQLIRAGLDGNQALAQMAPTLEHLNFLAEQQGYELDNITQKRYDDAVALGYIEEQQMSLNDVMLAGLGLLLQALGVDVPAAMREAMNSMDEFGEAGEEAAEGIGDAGEDAFEGIADAASDAFDNIEDDMAKAAVALEQEFSDGADGAIGDIKRISNYISDADFSANFNLDTAGAFSGLPGSKLKTKKMATGFEGIIDQPTLALIGESGPEAVNVQPLSQGQPSAPSSIIVNNNVILNGTIITDREYTRKRMIPEILSALESNLDKTRFKEALGVS